MLKKKTGVSSTTINMNMGAGTDAPQSKERCEIPAGFASSALEAVNRGVSAEAPSSVKLEQEAVSFDDNKPVKQGLEIELSSGAKTKSNLVIVDPNTISIDFSGNKRNVTEKKVKSLVPLIIESNGNSEPYYIRVHPDPNSKFKYQAITGKRRTLASRLAKTQSYCMLIEASYEDSVVLASHENEGREPFTVFERADQIQELIDVVGNKTKAIKIFNSGHGSNLSRSHSYDLVLPAKVSKEIRELIEDSKSITIAQVKKLLNQVSSLNEELDVNERAKFLAGIGREVPILTLASLIKEKVSSVTGVKEELSEQNESKEITDIDGKAVGTFDYKKRTLKLNKSLNDELINELLEIIQLKITEV
ncbi:hypothetical protein [Psychromonas sp. SP041]|uniref:hypothetical protein n=1 Tax=Psychromonas sp. SP041 TaxID=1365007 RepID=UPI00040B12EB|nr:hypothetical protein [Psychromonas sp. SP041]